MSELLESLNSTFADCLTIDITRKQVEQLKQAIKKLHRLDYSGVGLDEKRDFEATFIQHLRDIQVELSNKKLTNQVVDKQAVFDEVMEMINAHVSHIDMLSKLNDEFNGTSMKSKKRNHLYTEERKNSF